MVSFIQDHDDNGTRLILGGQNKIEDSHYKIGHTEILAAEPSQYSVRHYRPPSCSVIQDYTIFWRKIVYYFINLLSKFIDSCHVLNSSN
jgi:hypothetical protein